MTHGRLFNKGVPSKRASAAQVLSQGYQHAGRVQKGHDQAHKARAQCHNRPVVKVGQYQK